MFLGLNSLLLAGFGMVVWCCGGFRGWGVSILCLWLLCFGSSVDLVCGLFISCLIGYGSCRRLFCVCFAFAVSGLLWCVGWLVSCCFVVCFVCC